MAIYHNSSSRSLTLGTNETARITIGGAGGVSFNNNAISGISTYSGSGDMTISKNGTPISTVETSQNSGQDALLRIRGARTSSSTSNIAKIQFDNKTSSAYTMAEIVARDPHLSLIHI